MQSFGIEQRSTLQPVTVQGDAELLWNVFSNLVDNAIKYRREESPRLEVSLETGEGEALVRVCDNGVGLAPEEAEKVFERFYQGAAARAGLGLGLCIARLIVERFGGRITLESEGKGRGTCATVALRLAGDAGA